MVHTTGRAVRLGFATAAFLAVCVATLTPANSSGTSTEFWCIACGELGGLDVLANIVMFVPLGLSLAMVFGRRLPVMLICLATTLAVELLQIHVITGRDASASDLLANTLGGLIGTELAVRWPDLVRPSQRAAMRLAVAWSAIVLMLLTATAWGLGPAFVPRSLWIQRTPPRPSYEPFTGRLLAFDIDGINLPSPYPDFDLHLERHLQHDGWTSTALVDTRGLRPLRSIIVRVAEEFSVILWVDQVRWNVTCQQKMRAAHLRFRSPRASLVDGLRPTNSTSTEARLICARRYGALDARVTRDGTTRSYSLRLSPSLGWLLLSPFDIAFDDRHRAVSALWLIALLAPAGYWSSSAHRRRSDLATGYHGNAIREPRTLGAVGFLSAVVGLALGLAAAPRLFGVATGVSWEWAAGLAGIALGALLHRLVAGVGPAGGVGSSSTRRR